MAFIAAVGNPVYDSIVTPQSSTGGRVLSGCSTNGSIALARLGHETALVGSVGPDYQSALERDARRYGIAPYLQLGGATGGFSLHYDERGERTLDVLGVADVLHSFPAECKHADAIIIGPIMQETPLALVEQIRAASDAPLLLDPQGLLRRISDEGRIGHYRNPEIERIAPLCTVVKANELETRVLTGIDPRAKGEEAVRQLHALGCAIAIVTLAEAGSLIYDGRELHRIPAFATNAIDPTGAGDTYMAGFLDAYLQSPWDLRRAGVRGAACASIWIEHTGPDAPVTRGEVERRAALLEEHERGI
jgi:sugar/nucleoside kinase (ribokinase family)